MRIGEQSPELQTLLPLAGLENLLYLNRNTDTQHYGEVNSLTATKSYKQGDQVKSRTNKEFSTINIKIKVNYFEFP